MVEKKEVSGYEILKEGSSEILRIDANRWPYLPSVEDNPIVMAIAIDRLAEIPSISGLMFHQVRNYSYDEEQTRFLSEIANIYKHLLKQKKILALANLGSGREDVLSKRYAQLQYLVMNLLRTDPIGCYVESRRLIREEKIKLEKDLTIQEAESRQKYIEVLNYIKTLLERTKLVEKVKESVDGYQLGNRELYREIFRAVITPDFMYTKLAARPPAEGEQIDAYSIKDIDVVVYKIPGDVRYLYHVTPPEFKLTEDKYMLLDLARTVLAEHKPKEEEFLEPDKMRRTFTNIGIDLIQELANTKNIEIGYEEVEELARILVRYTVGFGLIEVLLQDPSIQDIVVNGPIGETPIFLVHQDYGECITNIVPSREDADGWASKFRLLSGRPLDEANPVLDTELAIPGARARIAVMGFPLSPHGLAYALRRHRDEPWTLPLFIENKMISPLGAGLLSFLIDGARSIIIAGTRSSGKTSFLGSLLVEIMRKYRIITVEGTLELPIDYLRGVGYNIQPMKVREALTSGTTELSADEGIRTSLRLGDSALIVGEVRSVEAKALFESMRVGALANVVAGTIHGGSPYAVYDRVVNDLQVPKTSFKATDIILITNPVRSPDGLHKWKRVLEIAEVRKHWEDDPLRERGFVDLMKYNVYKDLLEPTADLINGDSEVIKDIASNIKEWAGNWEAIWDNILLRAKIKETLVEYSRKSKRRDILEAAFVVKSNDAFHHINEKVREEVGSLDSKRIFEGWDSWVRKDIKGTKV